MQRPTSVVNGDDGGREVFCALPVLGTPDSHEATRGSTTWLPAAPEIDRINQHTAARQIAGSGGAERGWALHISAALIGQFGDAITWIA